MTKPKWEWKQECDDRYSISKGIFCFVIQEITYKCDVVGIGIDIFTYICHSKAVNQIIIENSTIEFAMLFCEQEYEKIRKSFEEE